ncbi:MAG: terpene cyclase/mutase family protein [Verrucomicrobia bacterium]|nr:terpene cyclase/mutase family protein [Verrucomicrobiota bacterium]
MTKLALALVLSVAVNSFAADGATDKVSTLPDGNASLRNEVRRAIAKGLGWLEKNQDPKGFWSTADHPAVTALALVAAQGDPTRAGRAADAAFVDRGYAFLKSCVHDDGSVYAKKELVNYNTSVALMAFSVAQRAEFKPVILKARQYLIGTQVDLGEPGKVDNVFDGGIGYGSKYEHSDMANTLFALEALYYSKAFAEDQKLAGARDLNWPAVIHFIQSCQNLPNHNVEKWASDDPQNKGGFIYYPGQSMAGETNLASGRVAFRSYGSASYMGLLSYIYADLKRDDPRVVAVMDWLRANYTLAENPGMGPQGIFYYLHTMTKALSVYGADVLETKDGAKHNWREEAALKLIDLQKGDGSWANDNGRWWEKDPALVTAYALISLEMIERRL